MQAITPSQRCAVLLAHPGHELVIHGFVEKTHPLVAVLTDGSGANGTSRIDSTTRLLEPAGASPLPMYAQQTDRACYKALLERDADFFIAIAEELAGQLAAAKVEMVVGDAAEGWNPIHDIWRSIVNAAVALAERRSGRAIANYDFMLFASHRNGVEAAPQGSLSLDLDAASYERKIAAGSTYTELHAEVGAALHGTTAGLIPSRALAEALDERLGGLNAESYRFELLRRVDAAHPSTIATPRVYELYGEMMVAQGRYETAIRHDQHLLPIETALGRHVSAERAAVCAFSSPTTT
jgi:hypothetical protein